MSSPAAVLAALCLLAALPGFAQDRQPGPRLDYEQQQAMDELRRGVRAYHQGFFNDAIVTLRKALGIKPEEPLVRMWLGRALFQSGYEDAAIGEWRQTLALPLGRDLPRAVLENHMEILAARRSPAVESEREERWVQTAELPGVIEKTTVFSRPAGLSRLRDGFSYLVSFGSHEVLLLDPNGVARRRLRGGISGFDHPFDVAVATDGSLFVSEFKGDRIAKCSPAGDKIKTIGRRGRGPGELIGPQYLCLDDEDNLYVSDFGNGRVVKYDRDGKYLLSFGPPRRGQTMTPTGLAYLDGRIYVADARRGGLQVFDVHGNYETVILEEQLRGAEGIRVTEDGTLLVSTGRSVLRVNPELETAVELHRFPEKARVLFADMDANGNLLAADFDGNRVHVFGSYQDLYRGLQVYLNRIAADTHPEVLLEATVLDRFGRPVISLDRSNFLVTEDHRPVGELVLQKAAYPSPVVEVALLVEYSIETGQQKTVLEKAVRAVYENFGASARIRIVAASAAPALLVKPGSGPAAAARDVLRREGLFGRDWSFDTGVRLAVSELLNESNRRAVVFVGSGRLPEHAFRNHGFQEVLGYLRNNSTVLYAISLGNSGGDRELELLSRESGGRVYAFQAPASITGLPRSLRDQKSGTYYLKYRSGQDTEFGRRLISVELETVLAKRSGRDELGYFGPLR